MTKNVETKNRACSATKYRAGSVAWWAHGWRGEMHGTLRARNASSAEHVQDHQICVDCLVTWLFHLYNIWTCFSTVVANSVQLEHNEEDRVSAQR
jgi:hypothetical protein